MKADIPWKIPDIMASALVCYSVSRINSRRTKSVNINVCPRVRFNGIKINYKRELGLAFGDHVEAKDNKAQSKTLQEISLPCIALYPAWSTASSWILWSIISKKELRRTFWKKMRTNAHIIKTMNALSKGVVRQVLVEQVEEPIETEDKKKTLKSKMCCR